MAKTKSDTPANTVVKIFVLAGTYAQFTGWLSGGMHSPYSYEYIGNNGWYKLMGMEGKDIRVICVGTWYERRDATAILQEAKSRGFTIENG